MERTAEAAELVGTDPVVELVGTDPAELAEGGPAEADQEVDLGVQPTQVPKAAVGQR